jgi:hypothetical protein
MPPLNTRNRWQVGQNREYPCASPCFDRDKGRVRTPSYQSRQHRTLQNCANCYGLCGNLCLRRDGGLTKKRQDLLEIIKPRLVHLLHRKHRLNHGSNSNLGVCGSSLSSPKYLLGGALVYFPSESLCTSNFPCPNS